ncbi:cytochrome p450 monooxygenase [Colletotrichum musicola]|uniref:Cytochrome p450 monooxygenase n=1 Tax=Colletotrichum musicola TaxID=2175873 RepID=A0A8H6J399_9PEZI|nr:cytochrome p450 monooxygenase [Colletotrichum musicola]
MPNVQSVPRQPPTEAFYVLVSAVAALSFFLYSLYQYLLPKPIPGIPYNAEATKNLMGDIPRLQKEADTNLTAWLINQTRKHKSPIFQAFIEPLRKPSVFITDFREAQDILMRRKEFDRSDYSISLLSGESPQFHINLKTGNEWKAHRRLLQDLMTPKFLHGVAAPNIYKSATRLLDLWKMKTRIAGGKPFKADDDVFYAAMDAVFDFGFGDAVEERALIPQIKNLESGNEEELRRRHVNAEGSGIDFPVVPIYPSFEAILKSVESIGPVSVSGFPAIAWWLIGLKPSVRRNRALIESFLKDQIMKAVDRYKNQGRDDTDDYVISAIDLMVQREGIFAKKEEREPVFWSPTMKDEAMGFIVAGHDTTSTTLCWGIKFLADNPEPQNKLREILRNVHSSAASEGRAPTYAEIVQTSVPYLDAVVEEILRIGHTVIVQERQCKEDTVVLGHHIPKGTNVFVANRGASFTEPAFDIPEARRSTSCQTAGKERGTRAWDADGMSEFRPERWLVRRENGKEAFDSAAGPTIPFGLGLRGCFGRRLAYMEMKLILTLLIWTFELLPCPEGLSSYDDIEGLTRKPKQCYVNLKVIS